MNIEQLLTETKFEKCGPMRGVAFVHPVTMEVSATKQDRPWVSVRPTSKASFSIEQTPVMYLQSVLNPSAPVEVVTPVEPVLVEETEAKPKRGRKPKVEVEGGDEAPKVKRPRKKKGADEVAGEAEAASETSET